MEGGAWLTVELGGLNERLDAGINFADNALHLQYDEQGYWQPCWGLRSVSSAPNGSGRLSAIHWFERQENLRQLIVERRLGATNSRVSYIDYPAGTYTDIQTRRRLDSHDLGTQFIDRDGWCYMLSPTDGLVRWDGDLLVRVGFTEATPSPRVAGPDQAFNYGDLAGGTYPASFNTGRTQRGLGAAPSSGVASWRVAYSATIINDLGQESPPSEIKWASGQNDTSDGKHLVQVIMSELPDNIKAVRIWRSINQFNAVEPGSMVDQYLQSEWSVAGGFVLVDHTPDTELGVQLNRDELGQVPIGAKVMADWQNSFWLAGMPDSPSRLRYSHPGQVEQFPEINYLQIGSSATGPIVALVPAGRSLFVFKRRGIYAVKGNAVAGYTVSTISESDGANNWRGVVVIPELNGIFFIDPNSGPKLLTGTLDDDQPTTVRSLNAPIRRTWKQRARYVIEHAFCVYDPVRKEVWVQASDGGDPRSLLGLVFHVNIGTWSTRPGWSIGAFEFAMGRLWVGSNDDTSGNAGPFLVTPGSRTHHGTTINGVYRTQPHAEIDTKWTLAHVEARGLANGASIGLRTLTDQALDTVTQPDLLMHHADHRRDKWGTGLWGTEYVWTDEVLTSSRAEVKVNRGHDQQIRINGQRFRIMDLRLGTTLKAGEQPKWKRRSRDA